MLLRSHGPRADLRSLLLLFSLSTLTRPGCALLDGLLGGGGEPAAAVDATPPPGYAPIYVQRIAPFAETRRDATISLTRVDVSEPSRVRIYAHLLDSTGAYLSDAPVSTWQRWLCELREEIGGRERVIEDLTIREVSESERLPHAVAIVMDHSGSMGDRRARAVQDAVHELIGRKKEEDAIALLKYDGSVEVEVPLTTDRSRLQSGLQRSGLDRFGGYTAIGNGLHRGITEVATADPSIRRAVIVFTDGEDNRSTIDKDSVIRLARRQNVPILAVDFGTNTDADYLREVAAETGGSYYRIYGTGEFSMVFEDIYRRLRNYYLIEYRPATYGEHAITARLCLRSDTAVATAIFDNTPEIGDIALLNVYFDVARSDLKPTSDRALENVVALMQAYPKMTIEVRGHTDSTNSTGDPDFNMTLSEARAAEVRKQLIIRGIEARRITATGYGDTRPVADNRTEEGRARNRRTEFLILDR